ncbi:hypothetical protein GGQ84_002497 [Desulfitispora alkaliphila]|uniref:hypothetical protein n=1 Tax=Desulfitispora alkaliphila TaxID=622674 RepID=UPI003D1AFE87
MRKVKKSEEDITDYATELNELYIQLDQEINKAIVIHKNNLPTTLPDIAVISMAAYYHYVKYFYQRQCTKLWIVNSKLDNFFKVM